MSFFDLPTEKEDLFDFIYDYTFLCAFDVTVRTLWAEKMSDLLKIGGELLTLIFPLSETKEGGPPFKMSFSLLKNLLGDVNDKLRYEELRGKKRIGEERTGNKKKRKRKKRKQEERKGNEKRREKIGKTM